MKYYVVKIIVSFILMHSFAFSQTKNITIIDKENGKPISEATVSVGYDTSTMRSFTTDHTGTVKVSVKISQQPFYLRATHVGYSSIDTTFIVHDTEGIAFLLSPKSISLEEVSITKEKEFIQEDRGNFKLNVQSSPLASVSNAWDFLKYAPAVESRFDGTLRIDGKGATVFINGRQIYLTGQELKGYLERLPSANIESIEVLPNPSAQYGSAVSSIISIKTVDLKYDGVKGTASLTGIQGHYGRYNSDVTVDIKKRAVTAQIGYNYALKKILETNEIERSGVVDNLPWSISQTNKTEGNTHKLYANIGIDINENSTLTGYIEYNPNNRKNWLNGNNGDYNINREALGDSIWQSKNFLSNKSKTLYSQLSYGLKWDSTKQSINLTLGFSKNKGTNEIANDHSYYHEGQLHQNDAYYETDIKRNTDAVVFSGTYNRNLLGGVLSSGVRLSNTGLGNSNVSQVFDDQDRTGLGNVLSTLKFDYNESNYGVFATWQKQINSWYMQVQALLEHNKVTSQNNNGQKNVIYNRLTPFPSVFLYKKLNDKNNFSFSYSTQLSRPDYELLNPFARLTDNTTVIFTGNDKIKPAKFHYLTLRWSHKNKLSLTLGANIQRDVISTFLLQQDNQLIRQYDNFDGAYYYLSANHNFKPFPFWNISLYAQASTIDVEMYNNVPLGSLTYNFYGSVVNDFVLPKDWVLSLGVEASSKRGDRYFVYRKYNNVNITVAKELKKPGVSFFIKASDIFRDQISAYKSVYLPYSESAYGDHQTISVGISYRFGKGTVKSKEVQKDQTLKNTVDRITN